MSNEEIKYLMPADEKNCDKEVSLGSAKIKCISHRKSKEFFRSGDYKIIGEITGKAESDDKLVNQISIGRHNFDVAKPQTHNRLIYANNGYIQVGENEYESVLTSRIPFFIVIIVLLLCLGILGTALMNLPKQKVIEPYNQLPENDVNAEKIGDGENTEKPKSGNSVSMSYTLDAKLHLSSGEIDIYYYNPSSSTQAVCLILCVITEDGEEIEIARSGAIKPGFSLNKMIFNGEATLFQGIYNAYFSVPYYNCETGERSAVAFKIDDVTLTVTNS